VRDGGEHVRVDHEAVAGQAPAERLEEGEPAAGYLDPRDLTGFVR
jgi:hypothetical protein